MEYKIISVVASKVCDVSKINQQVNDEIKNGFEPLGNASAVYDIEHKSVVYFQTLLKRTSPTG